MKNNTLSLSPNVILVLAKRNLMKDAYGNSVESFEEIFRRIAKKHSFSRFKGLLIIQP
jgi:ribonucleotide reductase alpha subunit